jgi:hypothetical protein
MRTKTLLIAVAALAMGAASSMAQTYSQNVVGYINLPLTNGFTMIANQLDVDGKGTNNTVGGIFGTNLAVNSQVLAWLPSGGYSTITWAKGKSGLGWSGDTNVINKALSSGQGVFVKTTNSLVLTLVGNVIQGTNVNPLVAGYNLVSAVTPVSGAIQTNLNYIPSPNDQILKWSPASQTFALTYSYSKGKSGYAWSPSQPVLDVGDSIFLKTTNTSAIWTNIFNIQ